jgi:hypothetical protein
VAEADARGIPTIAPLMVNEALVHITFVAEHPAQMTAPSLGGATTRRAYTGRRE